MLGHQPFYHSIIRKHVALFGTLFNDITIRRSGPAGRIDTINVPIEYAPRDKTVARFIADPEFRRNHSILLPRMSFEMTSMAYDPSRSLNRMAVSGAPGSRDARYTPAPYDLNFELNIYVRLIEDGTKIVEQILPYFRPDWKVSARLVEGSDEVTDIPIVLTSVNHADTYEGDFMQRRAVIWTLGFVVKAVFFGPAISQGPITLSKTSFFVDDAADASIAATATPGQTAAGLPTSDPIASVPRGQVNPELPYGFIVDRVESP